PYEFLGNTPTRRPACRLDMLSYQPYPGPRGLDGAEAGRAALAIAPLCPGRRTRIALAPSLERLCPVTSWCVSSAGAVCGCSASVPVPRRGCTRQALSHLAPPRHKSERC